MGQIMQAVFICMMSIFATMLTLFVMGNVMDRIHWGFNTVSIDIGDIKYPHQRIVVESMFRYMYSIPVFFIWVSIIWMFKVSIWDTKYTREDKRYEF